MTALLSLFPMALSPSPGFWLRGQRVPLKAGDGSQLLLPLLLAASSDATALLLPVYFCKLLK